MLVVPVVFTPSEGTHLVLWWVRVWQALGWETTNDEKESWMRIGDVPRTVGTLAGSATTSAASAARHPLRTTARVAGFAMGAVSGTAQVAYGLVRATPPASDTMPLTESGTSAGSSSTPAPPTPAPVSISVPAPDLPEPVVITGAAPTTDEVHHEPKAASRDSAHGGGAGDREEAGRYVEEIPNSSDGGDDLLPGADQLVNDDPGPLIEPGSGAAARKEADRLARAADPRPE